MVSVSFFGEMERVKAFRARAQGEAVCLWRVDINSSAMMLSRLMI